MKSFFVRRAKCFVWPFIEKERVLYVSDPGSTCMATASDEHFTMFPQSEAVPVLFSLLHSIQQSKMLGDKDVMAEWINMIGPFRNNLLVKKRVNLALVILVVVVFAVVVVLEYQWKSYLVFPWGGSINIPNVFIVVAFCFTVNYLRPLSLYSFVTS